MDWKCKLNVFCLLSNACAVYVIVSVAAEATSNNDTSSDDHVRTTPVAQASTSSAEGVVHHDESSNCFRHMHNNAWAKVAVYDSWAAAINVFVNHSGPHVLTCLDDQSNATSQRGIYQISLVKRIRTSLTRRVLVSEPEYFTPLALTMPNNIVQFKYVIFRGNYRVQFRYCHFKNDGGGGSSAGGSNESGEFRNCGVGTDDVTAYNDVIESETLKVSKDYPLKSWCSKRHQVTSNNHSDTFSIVQNMIGSDRENYVNVTKPVMAGKSNSSLRFTFTYSPCTDEIFNYEGAKITIYTTYQNSSRNACLLAKADMTTSVQKKKARKPVGNKNNNRIIDSRISGLILNSQTDVKAKLTSENTAQISFLTGQLEGDKYYCAVVESNHALCRPSTVSVASAASEGGDVESPEERRLRRRRRKRRRRRRHHTGDAHSSSRRYRRMSDDEDSHRLPEFCVMATEMTFLPNSQLPFIAGYLPFCTSHWKCGWIYIAVVGAVTFLTSCILAVCFVKCCCKNKRKRLRTEDQQTFDTLCLHDENEKVVATIPKKSWSQMHDEFYAEPPKNPGKILLLYSPDSKQFKELQKSFRNFLEMACHCVVLDLFDEQLFQTICYDPEAWLTNLLQDRFFKIIIVCSEGAFKRQQALVKGEVLNIPRVDSSLDGLFSAGLRFIQERHAYDHNRLTLVRYDNLALTRPDFKLTMMSRDVGSGASRMTASQVDEFVVPHNLPDLFCWIHDCPGDNFSGRPWDRYHLELQLLMDDLKQARAERRISKS